MYSGLSVCMCLSPHEYPCRDVVFVLLVVLRASMSEGMCVLRARVVCTSINSIPTNDDVASFLLSGTS
jgi:hypothetical protein